MNERPEMPTEILEIVETQESLMDQNHLVPVAQTLRQRFEHLQLHRPERMVRYEPGDELNYEMAGVEADQKARVRLAIEKFVGGGFAGQVYRIRVLGIETDSGTIEKLGGIEVHGVYAMKILIPPSDFSVLFRNFVYWLGFQGPFQLQVNPAAARAGAIWQKFIRRAAKIRFGDESCINDIHVIFVDPVLGSCGELSDWVDGRTWRLEVDENLDTLKRWKKGKPYHPDRLRSPEYRSKKMFMGELVQLLHDMGAHEFARQYEWSTCKSQPNALKRTETEQDPTAGLMAVDFRAGLALLPFLPMSPGDFKLIWQGLKRGSLVQFDRGSLQTLEAFVNTHREAFSDMLPLLEELKQCETIYRRSLPDVTHNHLRLFYDGALWRTMLDSAVTGWSVRNLVDEAGQQKLRDSRFKIIVFFLLGLVPILGRALRKSWCHAAWRNHYKSMLSSWDYFQRAVKGRIAERVLAWYRAGRIGSGQVQKVSSDIASFMAHKLLSLITWAGLHRFITDGQVRKEKLYAIFVRPIRLYFNAELREQWMRDMVQEGRRKHILTDEDAETIISRLNEPYIQRYLVSLVVHLLTLPVTQVVSVSIAVVYYITHRDQPNAWAIGLGIIGLFQVTPVSPGSFCRGLYTTIMAIRDRSFKDYNIALFLSYFKYVGYLAFPIQMTHRYPTISRFMAGHWATDAVHIVPVFGEQGALLEHWVFCLFYNWPLTIRRRMQARAQVRALQSPRYWHLPVCAVLGAVVLSVTHMIALFYGQIPSVDNKWFLANLWFVILPIPVIVGGVSTVFSGGLPLGRRIIASPLCGLILGILYSVVAVSLDSQSQIESTAFWMPMILRSFFFAVFCTIGVLVTELLLPDPNLAAENIDK
ncbi:MAG: hypothetical protein JW828_14100 [Sedimentisphaerales bacterium]|nr:hypothetical protein [Sedimentisphaerales bacterium]